MILKHHCFELRSDSLVKYLRLEEEVAVEQNLFLWALLQEEEVAFHHVEVADLLMEVADLDHLKEEAILT